MSSISFSYANPLRERLGEEFFKTVPAVTAVYYFLDAKGKPLYIGKADNLKRRLADYRGAKPGQTSEHILEMLEHANEIRWETHPTSEAALTREEELVRSLQPRYNRAMVDAPNYIYLGLRSEKSKIPGQTKLCFQLSGFELPSHFTTYGCFRHRGKAKAGYTALLRLMFAASCDRERFQIPAAICRTAPPYVYQLQVASEFVKPLEQFLGGTSDVILHQLLDRLLAKDALPKQLYLPLQRDFAIAREFYKTGPKQTRAIAQRAGRKSPSVSRTQMDRLTRAEFKAVLKNSKPA